MNPGILPTCSMIVTYLRRALNRCCGVSAGYRGARAVCAATAAGPASHRYRLPWIRGPGGPVHKPSLRLLRHVLRKKQKHRRTGPPEGGIHSAGVKSAGENPKRMITLSNENRQSRKTRLIMGKNAKQNNAKQCKKMRLQLKYSLPSFLCTHTSGCLAGGAKNGPSTKEVTDL